MLSLFIILFLPTFCVDESTIDTFSFRCPILLLQCSTQLQNCISCSLVQIGHIYECDNNAEAALIKKPRKSLSFKILIRHYISNKVASLVSKSSDLCSKSWVQYANMINYDCKLWCKYKNKATWCRYIKKIQNTNNHTINKNRQKKSFI